MAVLFLALGPLEAAHLTGRTLFGTTLFRNELISVDPATGQGTIIGNLGEGIFPFGVAARSGRLYTYDQTNNRIREINKISGKLVSSIDIRAGVLKGEGAIAFRADGTGFLAVPLNAASQPVNDFYRFVIDPNTGTGSSTRLGSTGVVIDGMAFNSQGVLYAIGQNNGILYTINPDTGATTAVGPVRIGNADLAKNSPVAGIAIAPANPMGVEEIYASIDDRLYIIDPTSAAARVASAAVINFGPFIASVSGLVFEPGAGTLGNMSGRLSVGTGDNVAINGFIVRGTPAKRVVIRGLGPSLPFASGKLADPILQLFNGQGQPIAQNDDFASSPDAGTIRNLGLATPDAKESAILGSLVAGNYTAVLRGVGGGTGVGLVEIFDVDAGSGSRLANISTRGLVQSGDGALIGGLIVVGSASQRVVVRALGPDLANRGVSNVLADPNVAIMDSNGTAIKTNDNFMMDPDAAEISMLGLAPNQPLEAATIVTLSPGSYTAVVRGAGQSSGVALVESYNLTTTP